MTLEAVVFDWAGTLVDHGSCAPVAALVDLFTSIGIPLTRAEARADMGLAKRDHIAALLAFKGIGAERLAELYGSFQRSLPPYVTQDAGLLPGVGGVLRELRGRGLRIATTTGYDRATLNLLLAAARQEGFIPDGAACPSDAGGAGRPAPWMCYWLALRMRTRLPAMVKIGDTPADIAEGRNAGMWTIGITRTGNEVGLSAAEWDATPAARQSELEAVAAARLRSSGAHEIAASAAGCLPAIAAVAARLERGERPET